jgi:hypothetical protein
MTVLPLSTSLTAEEEVVVVVAQHHSLAVEALLDMVLEAAELAAAVDRCMVEPVPAEEAAVVEQAGGNR